MRATDATKCRPFVLTLSDQAHMWFMSLAPYSIDSFEQLAKLFLGHFATIAPRPATKQCLVNTKQCNDKSNQAYIERIDNLILEGEPLGDKAKVIGAVSDLKMGTKLWRYMTTN